MSREGLDEPFGPPPSEYPYRCAGGGTALLVKEAIIAAGMGMATFQNAYYPGFMPTVGCPGCHGYTMEYVKPDE
jgi:hypothetical protein